MFPEHKYPYTNFHDLNLDWVLEQLQNFNTRLDNVIGDAVQQAAEYTDQQLAQFKTDFAALKAEIYQAMDELNQQQQLFIQSINAQVSAIEAKVILLENNITAAVETMKAYTDSEIDNNNEYILDQISQQLIGLQVINYFTGEKVTVQEMFDYLALFHAQNAITYDELHARNKDYTTFAGYNITYTQLVTDGKNLIPA